jgi:hypothetical protein
MQYNPIKNCHIENAILRRTLRLAWLPLFFMFSPNSFWFWFFRKLKIGSLGVWKTRFGTRFKCLNQKTFKAPLVTIAKKLHKSNLKIILTLKAQFEEKIWWHI